MRTTFQLLLLPLLLLAPAAEAQELTRFLTQIEGEWAGGGKVSGQAQRFRLSIAPTRPGKFVRIIETPENPKLSSSHIFIRADGMVVRLQGNGTAAGGKALLRNGMMAITVRSKNRSLRHLYRLQDGTLQVLIHVGETEKKWRLYAALTYTRGAVDPAKLELEAQQLRLEARALELKAARLAHQAQLLRRDRLRGDTPAPSEPARPNPVPPTPDRPKSKEPAPANPESTPANPKSTQPTPANPKSTQPNPANPKSTQPDRPAKPNPATKPVRWIVPSLVRKTGAGKWVAQKGALRCTGPATGHALAYLGNVLWRDYTVEFEVRVQRGQFGLFMRGLSRGAQFPNLLGNFRVPAKPARWVKVRVEARGPVITLSVRWDTQSRRKQSRNPRFSNGLFGFAATAGCQFEIRGLRVHVVKSGAL